MTMRRKMTEILTIKKIRNKANAKKLKERYKQDYRERNGGMVVPIPMDIFLEKIQGLDHALVVKALGRG